MTNFQSALKRIRNADSVKDLNKMADSPLGPRFLILGHGRHGKDTVAELMAEMYGLTFKSSSLAALDVIWPALQEAKGHCYTSNNEAYADRHNNRMLWKELISLYNAYDKSALCRKILAHNHMYVGMRGLEEYRASKVMFHHVIWVDASSRHPEDPSMGIRYDKKTMRRVDNNGTLDDLQYEIASLMFGLGYGEPKNE